MNDPLPRGIANRRFAGGFYFKKLEILEMVGKRQKYPYHEEINDYKQ